MGMFYLVPDVPSCVARTLRGMWELVDRVPESELRDPYTFRSANG